MTNDNSQRETCAALDAIFNPLAKKVRKMRLAIEAMTDAEIQAALDVASRCAPCETDDADNAKTHFILVEALENENAKRIARNAPWLAVFVEEQPEGGAVLTVSHDVGSAITREFGTFEQAKAAGDAVQEFLTLLGRDAEFSYRQSPAFGTDFESNIPF